MPRGIQPWTGRIATTPTRVPTKTPIGSISRQSTEQLVIAIAATLTLAAALVAAAVVWSGGDDMTPTNPTAEGAPAFFSPAGNSLTASPPAGSIAPPQPEFYSPGGNSLTASPPTGSIAQPPPEFFSPGGNSLTASPPGEG